MRWGGWEGGGGVERWIRQGTGEGGHRVIQGFMLEGEGVMGGWGLRIIKEKLALKSIPPDVTISKSVIDRMHTHPNQYQ